MQYIYEYQRYIPFHKKLSNLEKRIESWLFIVQLSPLLARRPTQPQWDSYLLPGEDLENASSECLYFFHFDGLQNLFPTLAYLLQEIEFVDIGPGKD